MSKHTQTIRIPSPEEIVVHLGKAIKGHEQAKRMLACAAYAHLLRCNASSKPIRNAPYLENCLLAGPTGSGKSAMLQRLASYLRMPIVTVLASSLSPCGYRGKTCNEVLSQIEEAAVDEGIMTPTLCIWDELDKISIDGNGDNADIYKRMTQSDMLGIIQGVALTDHPGLDLKQVLHVGCGAFPEGSNLKSARPIGFVTPSEEMNDRHPKQVAPGYFISRGLTAELVGRFPRLGLMAKPDQQSIREIITDSITSPYRQKLWHFRQHGTELSFDDDAIDLLAEMISAHPTGVRAMQLVLNQLLNDYEYEITRSNQRSIEEIHYTRAAVAGTEEPMVIRGSTINRPGNRTIEIPKPKPPEPESPTEEEFGIF